MRIGDTQQPMSANLAALGTGGASPGDQDQAKLDAVRRAVEHGDAGEASRQFEKLFAVLLVRELRRTMPEGPFGDGPGADVYEGWFDEQLGGALSQRDALGLAGMIKSAIGRAQAAHDAAAGGAPAKEPRP